MKNKTILGSWCTEPNCKFIDNKHIQIELMAHIWYSYDDDSKTDVINKKLCFIKEINFDDFNNIVEILEEEKKIPEKLEYYDDSIAWVIDDVGQLSDVDKVIIDKLNDVIDYLKSKGE